MKLFKKTAANISSNIAEYYTLLILVVAIPIVVGMIVGYVWALLLSFMLQATIGILYIKGSAK